MKTRVFHSYVFNIIDKASFKETKPYLERMLSELGYSYKNLGFSLRCVSGDFVPDKILAKYPSLKKYFYIDNSRGGYTPCISSFPENLRYGDIHADKEDWDTISEVLTKIPRPFGVPFVDLVLDDINWFGDSDDSVRKNYSYPDGDHHILVEPLEWGSRIVQRRSFDDGRKRNYIYVCFEVTAEPELRDSKEIINRLIPYLGEPMWSGCGCLFAPEDILKWESLEMKYQERLEVIADDMLPKPKMDICENFNIVTNDPKISHISDKYTMNQVFVGTGFKREKGASNRINTYACTDKHGFQYQAETQRLTFGNIFRFSLFISGYNFDICFNSEDYYVTKEGESLEILKVFAQMCVKIRDEWGAELAKDFGETPSWYRRELWE